MEVVVITEEEDHAEDVMAVELTEDMEVKDIHQAQAAVQAVLHLQTQRQEAAVAAVARTLPPPGTLQTRESRPAGPPSRAHCRRASLGPGRGSESCSQRCSSGYNGSFSVWKVHRARRGVKNA